MPPWPPDPAYSRFAHEHLLSATEKNKIAAWVDGGSPQGNLSFAPPQPVFSATGDLPGTPNLVLQIPTYTSPAATSDMYRCFVLDPGLTVDKFITSFEAIPGNRSMVHHVLVFADTTGISTSMDAADPGPGYTSFGGIGTNDAIMLGGWVPGSAPLQFPQGFGVKVPHNAKIVVQIHYPAGTAGQIDSTKIRFFFSPTSTIRNLMIIPVLNHNVNISPALVIPANTVKSFTESFSVPVGLNVSVIGVLPHMHLLGQNITTFGITPTGDTQKIISIPHWDFHWQSFYMFKKILKIEGGSTAYAKATYDNTTNNPMNPSNPPQLVQAGESTTDEMMIVYFFFTFYQPGDENIVLDSTYNTAVPGMKPYYSNIELLQPYPVPAQSEVIAKMYFDRPRAASLDIINTMGQTVLRAFTNKQMDVGYNTFSVPVSSLAAGNYQMRLSVDGNVKTQKIIITK
jgi:hypothetical protein